MPTNYKFKPLNFRSASAISKLLKERNDLNLDKVLYYRSYYRAEDLAYSHPEFFTGNSAGCTSRGAETLNKKLTITFDKVLESFPEGKTYIEDRDLRAACVKKVKESIENFEDSAKIEERDLAALGRRFLHTLVKEIPGKVLYENFSLRGIYDVKGTSEESISIKYIASVWSRNVSGKVDLDGKTYELATYVSLGAHRV